MRIRKFLIVLSLTLGLLFFTTGTVAYYRYAVDGSIVATSANYTFNVSSGSTSTKEINLSDSLKPYDKGNFNLTVNLDLSSFDTSKITNMNYMFCGCTNLKNLNLGVFDTNSATNTYCMFYNCSNLLTEITIKNASTSRYTGMFSGCSTASGAKVTVNYTSSTSSIVDSMIATKSSNSNIIKGTQI